MYWLSRVLNLWVRDDKVMFYSGTKVGEFLSQFEQLGLRMSIFSEEWLHPDEYFIKKVNSYQKERKSLIPGNFLSPETPAVLTVDN